MLEWIDHDTFQKKGFATFYNYNNFIRIAIVECDSSKSQIIGVDNRGEKWIFGEASKFNNVSFENFKNEFVKFMNNRPPIAPTVPDIKLSKIQI